VSLRRRYLCQTNSLHQCEEEGEEMRMNLLAQQMEA